MMHHSRVCLLLCGRRYSGGDAPPLDSAGGISSTDPWVCPPHSHTDSAATEHYVILRTLKTAHLGRYDATNKSNDERKSEFVKQ